MTQITPDLRISKTLTASVIKLAEDVWHLEIPTNHKGGYRLAQLDDHGRRRRSSFLWRPPLALTLQARVSAQEIPGTWGVGLWNDPFSFLISAQGMAPRAPALPQAVWFFHASAQNFLSFRDDLPAQGFLAATFRSDQVPALFLALASPAMAFTLIPGIARLVRRVLGRVVKQDAALINTSVTEWHTYHFAWENEQVWFSLDKTELFRTNCAPCGPLSLVFWIDNQYAAFPPRGRLRYGTLPNPKPAWLELRELVIER